MEEEDYPSAIDYLQYVSSIDTLNYEDAQSKLEEAAASYAEQITEQVNQKIDDAAQKLNNSVGQNDNAMLNEVDNLYLESIDMVDTASYYLDEEKTNELYTLVYTNYYESGFEYWYGVQDYIYALSVYEEGANSGYVTWSAEITQKAAECKTAYRKDIIDRATEAYQADGYESAIQIISEGLAYLPDDEKLTEYYERFHACIPTPLNELTLLEGEDYYSDSSVEDIYGNRYQGYFDFYERDYDASATYYLGGEYTTFSGTYFGDEDIDSDVSVRFKVYADDVLIYDSDFFQRDQKAVDFSLDVSNVERLTIFSTGNDVYYNWVTCYPKAILTNAYVSSEFSSSGLG